MYLFSGENMLLFAVSFILVFSSSYFLSSVFAEKSSEKGFIYTLLIAFAQILVTTESLSLFQQIKPVPFLIINILFLICSLVIWIKQKRPVYKIDIKCFLHKFFNAVKLDKSLFILSLGWIFFIIISLILIAALPTSSADAFDYHVVRCYDWLMNHSLAHFETADIRINAFPINSEVLYLWILLFTKKQLCLGIFSFVGYTLFLISMYQIFKIIGYSMRRTLWTLLIISSFASVVVMVSGTETDLIIAGLITTSIYLFINAIKNSSDNKTLFMSSLAYALAIGTKTPAIICIPAIACLFIYLSFKHKDFKTLLKFIGFGIISFLIFSSYNFIFNFIDYGHIMGTKGCILTHKNLWGIKGFFANIIKHLFLLIDFSGFKLFGPVTDILIDIERNILRTLHLSNIPCGIFCGTFYFNMTFIEPGMGCGILSFLLLIPCWIISLILPLFNRKRFIKIRGIFAALFTINIITLSALIVFMTFNTRFLTSFILISAPMLACSYIKSNKNPLKILYILIALFYFIVASTNLFGRPFFRLAYSLAKTKSLTQVRSSISCLKYDKRDTHLEEWCNINALLDSKFNNKKYKVLFLPKFSENIIYAKIKQMQGYDYNFINAEHIKDINIDDYDVIVMCIGAQPVTSFDKYSANKIDYYLTTNKKGQTLEYYPLDKNTDVACYYSGINGVISKQMHTENEIPTTKVCSFTTNFFKNHPFEYKYRTDKYYIITNKNTFN